MNATDKMLNNFVKKHGKKGLRKLTYFFVLRKSNVEIGRYFGVTRQRVHQWQKAFTTTHVDIKPFVSRVLLKEKA
jgi:DNA-directed RNA polymerase sigma subunit (sigma70/sigma32)